MKKNNIVLLSSFFLSLFLAPSTPSFAAELRDHFMKIPEAAEWGEKETIVLDFESCHPQGLVKVDDRFFLSTVKVDRDVPKIFSWLSRRDQSTKPGSGLLIEFDEDGKKIRELNLGEGDSFHPGGMDFDGEFIWVPVAEYRPKSSTVIYQVSIKTWTAAPIFKVEDHIGALVFNRDAKTLVGMNWNAQHFYEWTLDGKLLRTVDNKSKSIQYQDCKYAGDQSMICSGKKNNARGGLDLISLYDFRKIHEIRFSQRTEKYQMMARNAMAVESRWRKLRFYFVPEDHKSTVYVYTAK